MRCVAAATADGTCLAAYLPTGNRVTVDASRVPRWHSAMFVDPTSGDHVKPVIRQEGRRIQLTPPPRNREGDADWLLLIQ